MPAQQPLPKQPVNEKGHPAFFTPEHNAWLEDNLSYPTGSVSKIYQADDACVRAAKNAIRRTTPPQFPEAPVPALSRSIANRPPTPRFAPPARLLRSQQRIQKRDQVERKFHADYVTTAAARGYMLPDKPVSAKDTDSGLDELAHNEISGVFKSPFVQSSSKATNLRSYAASLENNTFGRCKALQRQLAVRHVPRDIRDNDGVGYASWTFGKPSNTTLRGAYQHGIRFEEQDESDKDMNDGSSVGDEDWESEQSEPVELGPVKMKVPKKGRSRRAQPQTSLKEPSVKRAAARAEERWPTAQQADDDLTHGHVQSSQRLVEPESSGPRRSLRLSAQTQGSPRRNSMTKKWW